MFQHAVQRLEGGEPYYAAMGVELRAGNYPTGSVFNWRTPALYLGLSIVPRWLSAVFMGTLCALVLGALLMHLSRETSPEGTVLGLILSASAVITLADSQGFWMTEAWAALLIGLSVAAYLRKAWVPAALIGAAALFLRELAAPYCVVCTLLAVKNRRYRECGVWGAALVLYGLYYGLHVTQVMTHTGPEDPSHNTSWIQFGGLGFWLATLQVNKALFATPRVFLTLVSVLLAAGLLAGSLAAHVRWTVVAYALFFAVVGQPFNAYWGFLAAFPYAVTVAHGPAVLESLARQALSRTANARAA